MQLLFLHDDQYQLMIMAGFQGELGTTSKQKKQTENTIILKIDIQYVPENICLVIAQL